MSMGKLITSKPSPSMALVLNGQHAHAEMHP
jgi:hypothetical protein